MANSPSYGKLVSQTVIKTDADVFHGILRDKPHHISKMSPALIHNCALHEGDWGKVGSVISWHYTHDGKKKVAKDIVEAIDESKKLVKFKVIEGDFLELYNYFVITVHVETAGQFNLVTWTLEYEKKNSNVADPHTFLQFLINVTKDMEKHHLK